MSGSAGNRLLGPLDLALAAMLATSGAWLSWSLFAAPRGERAVVWIDGRRSAWYPIDGEVRIDSVRGALGQVVLEHGGGSIRVVRAPCPGHLCIRQGAVHRSGEKLVCVPSRVVVTLEGGADAGDGLDAVH